MNNRYTVEMLVLKANLYLAIFKTKEYDPDWLIDAVWEWRN